jgi:hypothetical protein
MELVNLNDLMTRTKESFDDSLFDAERALPQGFKNAVPDFDGTKLVYKEYTCILVERTPGLNIVFPNQWFYIAAYMTDYYKMIMEYKTKVFNVLQFESAEKAKELIRKYQDNESEARNAFANYNGTDKDWLIRFVSDYSWWGGGKSIERNDFYVSPVLSLAKLVNASQSFVADICKFLAEHQDALEILRSELSNFSTDKSTIEAERKSIFLKYFSAYLRLSTGKSSPVKIEQYLSLVEKGIYEPIRKLHPEFSSIFAFGNKLNFTKFLEAIAGEIPSLAILKQDTWPKEKEQQTIYYEPWTFIRHYRNFLDIANDMSALNNRKRCELILKRKTSEEISALNSYLRAMRTKPFLLLAGISGTGKSRIVKELAFDSCPNDAKLREDETRPGNYCLIEVKPNWHDSTELLGYQSAIAQTYVLTPFVKFLAKAMLYPDVPFFVCLDEMNLAPVEQYFAEFLSVLESRKKLESGEIVSEPLIKADVFKNNDLRKALFSREEEKKAAYDSTITDDPQSEYSNADEQAIYEILKRDGLRIPQNVIVIGTVNMDETTHQFSRKVIDRAMTIEMNLPEGEPFMDFFKDFRELSYRDAEQPKELYLASEVSADKVVAKLRDDNKDKTDKWLLPEVAKTLTALNEALDGTPFKVAYRVQNEMMLYFGELWGENREAKWRDILTTTVDQILMMKVLPRVEGDEDLLEKPLERLATFCANYPHAAKKVAEMKERLSRSHFVSYWP